MYAGGVNFTSLLFMNVYRIYIFIACFSFAPLLMNWQKGGEVFEEFIYACLFHFLVYAKRGRRIAMHVYFLIYAYMFCFVYTFYSISYFYYYAWVKGELPWNLSLIHAYITPWVLSSSKKRRLLAQRPIALVLMMINSCSYSLLMILYLYSFSYWSRS